jgi:hypothetical protein
VPAGRALGPPPPGQEHGSAKRRRVAMEDLPAGVAGAVETIVWEIPQGLGSLGSKLRFGVICDAHPIWGWSGPLMRGRLVWGASEHLVPKAFRSTLGDDVERHEASEKKSTCIPYVITCA